MEIEAVDLFAGPGGWDIALKTLGIDPLGIDFAGVERRFLGKIVIQEQCWVWMGARTERGYGRVRIAGREFGAHRVAFAYANGELPPDLFICHRCDEPSCVRPAHLFAGTPAENSEDMRAKGRQLTVPSRGEANGEAKLTRDQVLAIRGSSEVARVLAARFDVSKSLIHQIKRGEAWSWL